MVDYLSIRIGNMYSYKGDAVIVDTISRQFVKVFNIEKNQFINNKVPVSELSGLIISEEIFDELINGFPHDVVLNACESGLEVVVDENYITTIMFTHQLQNLLYVFSDGGNIN